MTSLHRYLTLITVAFGLSSCDSVKNKLVDFLDEKIEETGGEAAADPAAEPGTSGGDASGAELIRQIGDADYAEFIKTPGHVMVVDFYADWCGPCKRLSPILKKIVEEHGGKVLLGKMDVDKHKRTPGELGVRGIPDVRIYVNGEQVDKFVGLMPEDVIRQKIEPHIDKISDSAPEPEPEPKPEPKPGPEPKPEPQPEPKPEPESEPGEPKEEPKIQKMEKDWLPPGIQRKGT